MKDDYSDLINMLILLNSKISILKNKYGNLDLDGIKFYELDNDINIIERLVSDISFKKDNIIIQKFDEYVSAFYETEMEQKKVVE